MKLTTVSSLILAFSINYSCIDSDSDSKNNTSTMESNKKIEAPTLTAALNERKEKAGKKSDDNIKKIYKDGLDGVANSGVLQSAKNVGDEAPDFSLKNAVGNTVSLNTYLKEGPVILTWYRGGWCPYCNLTLHYLQEELPNFKAQGANLIAISPETPDESISTKEKNELAFEALSDKGNKVAKEYGVVYKLTDELAEVYNQKFKLNEHNGDNSNELPIAATYIIDTDGKIVYAFLDFDYRNRAEPTELTKILKTLNKK